jgi:cholesterol oxidase
LGQNFYRSPINVTFQNGVNQVGVSQQACTLCGDCVTGCNFAAKNTILMNYLPDASNHGAEIYTQVGVRQLERQGSQWVVHYQVLDSGREAFDAPTLFLTANIVVLAGGVLGSSEILLRSKAAGLPLSDHVGLHFTGNGDVLGFGYDCNDTISGIGFGNLPPAGRNPVGPCITGIIDMRNQPAVADGLVVEEGSIPGALGSLIAPALSLVAPWSGKDLATDAAQFAAQAAREVDSLFLGPYHGAVQNTQTYLIMSHDNEGGQITLENDRARVHWPGVGARPEFVKDNNVLDQATVPLGGVYLKNPLWSPLTDNNLTTVHPLGGCIMAEDAAHGVVNHKGQVFSGADGTATYNDLYVSDGSVVPLSLGVNPLLTISALAERCCSYIAADNNWKIDYTLPSAPSATPPPPLKMGMRFTETMKGFVSTKVTDDFQKGFDQGTADNSTFEFTLTVISDDLNDILDNPDHPARLVGTSTAPVLSAKPMTGEGQFQLLVTDPTRVNTRLMTYAMKMTSEEGKTYFLDGTKIISDDGLLNIWRDTSTLFTTIYDGDSTAAPVLAKGILHIEVADFMRQMTTMQITNAPTVQDSLTGLIRFGAFFGQSLFDVYGEAVALANEFNVSPTPRTKRTLRLCPPDVHYFETADAVELRLTRYMGGVKGPVILSPGYGTSTLAYTIDTVDTNLPEYLYANGYDVWLFVYRASPALAASKTLFTFDDVATKDYPAAVAQILQISGAATVQVMAHCVGSMTFLMGMLSGQLQGVRSAVCSQLSFYPLSPPAKQLKAAFDIGNFFKAVGIDTLTTDFDPKNWGDIITEGLLKINPAGPPCNSAVCRPSGSSTASSTITTI